MSEYSNAKDAPWKVVGLCILCLRFVQGWIFWGGGSRRFIYDPEKLDPYSTQWMANKLQAAMPGALLGLEQVISFLLQHFYLLYLAIILFSLAELISGLGLILGFFTRLSAAITVLISLALMMIFGWQGTTCMDEWTMAVANFAIGLSLVLSGSFVYSLDAWWMQKNPKLGQKKWFMLLGSGSWPLERLQKTALFFVLFTLIFSLATYNYYRGAIFSAYHAGPVSADIYNLKLSQGILKADGSIQFNLYVNAGPTAVPTYILRMELLDSTGKIMEEWDRKALSSQAQIQNTYAYNQIKTGPYGLIAPVSAKANIRLPASLSKLKDAKAPYRLQIYTISGSRFDLDLN